MVNLLLLIKKFFLWLKLYYSKKNLFFIVSFPRSGQTPIVNFLKIYFEKLNLNFTYCEFYQCCNSIPCKQNSKIIKNHDYQGILPFVKKHKYLILMRKNQIDQLDSYFRFKKEDEKINYKNDKAAFENFKIFYMKNKKYYASFSKKWKNFDKKHSNVKFVYYDDFIQSYEDSVIEIVKFMEFLPIPDKNYISSVLKKSARITERLDLKKKNLSFLETFYNS